MARHLVRIACVALVATLYAPAAWAQYPSEVVGFNGPPIDDPATCQEMFRIPQWSGSTSTFVIPNTGSAYDYNGAYRASGLQTEGAAAMQVYFNWVDPADPNAWVRLTTYDGPDRPNPALHTQGKVRFKITNRSELFAGTIGLCLGIRETGVSVGQMENGGLSGTIEWVGVNETYNGITAGADQIVNTSRNPFSDDIQVYPVGTNIQALGLPADTVVIDPGPNGNLQTNPSGDDQRRYGYFLNATGGRVPIPRVTLAPSVNPYTVEFNLATGDVTVNGAPYPAGIVGFTGNNVLDPANNRGTLEHIALTNLSSDTAILIDVAIDELQFEAPVPDPTPAPVIQGPVVSSDTQVLVNCIAEATSAELFIDAVSAGTAVQVAGVATFAGLSLQIGDVLTATQTANAITSPLSAPVIVYAPGTALAENFDSYMSQTELETLWGVTPVGVARNVHLDTGGASSCDNFVTNDYVTGAEVGKLYYHLGSVNGTDAQPLWVTFRFRHSSDSTNCRERFELTPSLSKVYGAIGFAFTNGVTEAPEFGTQYTSMTNSPEPIITGYYSDYFGYDYALTGIERVAGVWHEMKIQVKSSVVNFYIDDVLANPIDPVSGTPVWPAGVPRVNNDAFQYIILGTGYATNGPAMEYDDIAVTFGGTQSPFGEPNAIPTPTVVGPLYPGVTLVDLSDVDPTATDVTVYANRVQIGTATGPFPGGTAAVTVSALMDGEEVMAAQTVGGEGSCLSDNVLVSVPAPTVEPFLTPGDLEVKVFDFVEGLAQRVTVYRDLGGGQLLQIGQVSNPTEDPAEVVVPALVEGWNIVATQTIGGIESPVSAPVTVKFPGFIAGWIQTTPLPTGEGRTDPSVVLVNDYIYCIAGRSDYNAYAVSTVYFAHLNDDGSIGEWIETTPTPQPIAAFGAAAYNGRIYVYGGWTDGFPTVNTCYYADPNPDGTISQWVLSSVTIPDYPDPVGIQMDAFGRGVHIWNNHLYIINGEWDAGTSFGNTNSCYYSTIQPNGDYGPWVETTPTATVNGSWFHGVAVIEGTTQNYMYRVAGNYRGTNESNVYTSVIAPSGALGEWVRDPLDLPNPRYEIACTVVDNQYIFALCGLVGSTPVKDVYYTKIDPDTGALGEWYTGPEYPVAVSRNTAIAYEKHGRWYILVVSGGPYSGGPKNPACYYTEVGFYYDLEKFAEFQQCFDPAVAASPDCANAFDRNDDDFVDFYEYDIVEEGFVGPPY